MGSSLTATEISNHSYDYSFKILLVGDSGVGKSSILVSFISNTTEDLSPTIGVDFKIKMFTVGGKKLKLTIWDTAGQERFRTVTSSYYRGVQGVILVYDVTKRETFTNLSDSWAKDVQLYCTNPACVKMLVGNQVDRESERAVTREEGFALAQEMGCLFLECSAKTQRNVQQCFEELALKVIDVAVHMFGQYTKTRFKEVVIVGLAMKSILLLTCAAVLTLLFSGAEGAEIFLEWNVATNWNISPVQSAQPVITINGMFPGPLINSTNDNVRVNIFNNLDVPLLMTWNGIQQRLNSWQDGVSGTNCPIQPGTNWTYNFQMKDQIGSYSYFPSINFLKAAGGYGSIRVNNRNVILVPFDKPEEEYDLLIGDWFSQSFNTLPTTNTPPDAILINGKAGSNFESFSVTKGKTYRFRISNVGSAYSINFKIQSHQMVLVGTEGSYTSQIVLDSLDVHVGKSYSVLVSANQNDADYVIVASLTQTNVTATPAACWYKWNMTTGAARPNPQGSFNVTNVTISQTFVLHGSKAEINSFRGYAVNNVTHVTPDTPLKLADFFVNGSGVYQLDEFPVDSVNEEASFGTSVVTGIHKGWIEIIFKNDLSVMDAWHLDGFGFYVVGFGDGEWSPGSRETYNLYDPVVRSTVQVYPGGWSAVYAFLDNPGMWNLRSQRLENWFLGQEFYVRVHNSDPNPTKERPPPNNLLLCGIFDSDNAAAPAPSPQSFGV
ncbi:hypothetical protein C5167_033758 [Papaver somniferum]|uniref:Plastocyanin-like domain-containing protein n=1 Tax=Papaver somniferum TaxID=3469 RepID=A0A4Y7KB27_PAPSO|nr:hypothetical protein C5167_033758 [Papaver somniferum]